VVSDNVPYYIARKEKARQEKVKDKAEAMTSENIKVITMDLQAVLLCPSSIIACFLYSLCNSDTEAKTGSK
jgi:hypothetical protein